MEENILLMFLSPVQVDEEGKVRETEYKNIEGENTKTTNESAVRYIIQNSGKISKIFILVSEGVQKNITYRDKNKAAFTYLENNQPITHLDFFKKRMKNFLDVESCITAETIYYYNENNSGEENLKSVAEVAKLIQNYSAGKKIILHADLTGGMRHINMMMLDIIRLLEYSGVEIEQLLYSNLTTKRVEEVKNIYDLFQLISGVEEFINFGSVNALKKYYDDTSAELKISDKLQDLLAAMKNFADSINLCRYGKFTDAIKQLHDAINDFEIDSENVQDILMARLIEKIREKYEKLIATRGEDDLKILSWCIENGYLQQTLTLYTERVPEYLYKNFIVLCKRDKKSVEKILEEDNRNIGFYVLNNYLEDDENFKNARADFENDVSKMNVEYFSALKKIVQSKNFNCDELFKKLFDGKILPSGVKFPNKKTLQQIFELLDATAKKPQIFKNLDAPELLPLKKIIDAIKPKLESFEYGKQRGQEILKFLNSTKLQDYFPEYECDTRIFRLEYMLNQKIFRLKMDKEEFLGVMAKYFLFKDERNHSNHARQDDTGEFETAKELQDEMQRGLKEIEEIKLIELTEIEETEETVEKIFVNHTNHSSKNWSAEQKAAAEKFGRIIDFPFPEISPNLDTSEIQKIISKNLQEILKFSPTAVLCQGDFNYTFSMVEKLKKHKIKAVAAISECVVEEIAEKDDSTKKISVFKFVRFRAY